MRFTYCTMLILSNIIKPKLSSLGFPPKLNTPFLQKKTIEQLAGFREYFCNNRLYSYKSGLDLNIIWSMKQ